MRHVHEAVAAEQKMPVSAVFSIGDAVNGHSRLTG
jgi:hypothetical protein